MDRERPIGGVGAGVDEGGRDAVRQRADDESWRNRLASAVGVVAVVLIAAALIGMLLLMLFR